MLADRILFIDAEAMVVDKPAGLPVDAPRDGALAVVNHLDSLRFGFLRQPGIVHRLDRDTSGCLLLARNPKAHRRFAAAFEEGAVAKSYLAVLAGVPEAAAGVVDLPLAKISSREGGWRMVGDAARGKPAITRWERIAIHDGRALVRFVPSTGRTHQLRVHAAEGIGLPIAGDRVYGPPIAGDRVYRSPIAGDRVDGHAPGPMLLHAWTLGVPRGAKPAIAASAPPPATFAAFAEAIAALAGADAPDEAAHAPA